MDRRRLSLVVGIFVVASLAVGGLALLNLGQQSGLLQPRYRLVTYFENIRGLVAGAPVRLAGKDVGRVEQVTFAALGKDVPPVRVVLTIDAGVQDRIRSDSIASIGTIGLLGDKYVEIAMGSPEGRVLEAGEELASVSPLDLEVAIVRGTQAIDNVATLADNVNRVVEEFRATMGARGVAEAASGVADTTRSLAELVEEVKEGDGLLHSLIYDSYEGSGVESIERSLASLESVLQEVAHGDGLLHQLIYGTGETDRSLREALEALEHLSGILAKVDAGSGTLGLLVNDPTLYHDLKVLVGGAQRSLVVRSLVRLSTGDGKDGKE
jgi:phospholipid/cholesterol/gamma-HCH transport system substrate-binding protein